MTNQKNKNKTRGAFGFLPMPRGKFDANKTRRAMTIIRRLPVLCLLLLALGAAGDSARGVLDGNVVNAEKADGFRYSQWLRGQFRPPPDGDDLRNAYSRDDYSAMQQNALPSNGGADIFAESMLSALRRLPPDDDDASEALRRFANGDKVDFAKWRRAHFSAILARLDNDASGIISSALTDKLGALPSVRRVGIEWRSSFGGGDGQWAFRALGGWQLSADDVAGWQSRFYGDGKSTRGGSFGLFARSLQDGSLLGVNVFADYQKERDVSFWRASLGGEWRTAFGAASINRYWQLGGDKRLPDNIIAYTKEGLDAQVLVHLPSVEWISLVGDYYHWRGRYGEGHERGFRYGLRFRPGGGWRAGVYYGDDRWSADLSYERSLAEGELLSAGGIGAFDARRHFWDAVRREYGQRISRVSIRAEEENAGGEDREESPDALILAAEAGLRFRVLSPEGMMTVSGFGPVLSVYQSAPPTARARGTLLLTMSPMMALASDSGTGSVVIRGHLADWRLSMPQDTSVAFGGLSRVTIMDGGGAFVRASANHSPALFAVSSSLSFLTLGVDGLSSRFAFRAGMRAFMTLSHGALSVRLLPQFTAALTADIGPQNASLRVFGATVAIIGCGAITILWHLRAHCPDEQPTVIFIPPPLSMEVIMTNTIITIGGWQKAAMVSASGGQIIDGNDYRYSAYTAAGAEVNVSDDGAVSISVADAGVITATITADDDHANTNPATALITIRAVDSLVLGIDRTQTTITAHIANTVALATLLGVGGLPDYDYSLDSDIQGISLSNRVLIVSLSISAQTPVITSALTATAIIADAAKATASMVITLSVEVVNPPSLSITVSLANSIIITGALQAIATVSANGGYLKNNGDYRYSAYTAAGAEVNVSDDGAVSISVADAGVITATITADDDHANTNPATALITIRAVDSLVLGIDRTQTTITAHIANTVALATLLGVGGLPDYDYSLDSDIQGISLSNRVLIASLSISAQTPVITSALTATAIIADAAKATASMIITLSVEVVNPPSLSITVSLANSIIITGALQAIATISANGGYLTDNGDYRYSAYTATGAEVNVSDDGAVSISVADAGVITATITADDDHANTNPATALITIRAVDSLVLGIDRTQTTITAHIANTVALATLLGIGGLPDYGYSLDSDIRGISLSNRVLIASLSISAQTPVITSALTATAIIADAAKATASMVITLSVEVVNPPSLSITVSLANSIIVQGDLSATVVNSVVLTGAFQVVATVSVNGGYLAGGGDYRYSALATEGAKVNIADSGAVSISVADDGIITATITADDDHPNTRAATALITVQAIDSLALEVDRAQATVTAHIASTIALATLRGVGGLPRYRFGYSFYRQLPAVSLSGGIFILSLSVSASAPAVIPALTVTALIGDATSEILSAVITFSVEVVNPPLLSITASLANSIVITGALQAIATISAAGGYLIDGSDYRYSAFSAAAEGVEVNVYDNGAVSISIADAGVITATITADDDHANTNPATALITALATAALVLDADIAGVTLTYYADADATLATLRAQGGLGVLRRYALSVADDGVFLRGGSIVVLSAFVSTSSVYAFSAAVIDELVGVASLSVTASFSITTALVGAGPVHSVIDAIASATAVLDNRRQFIASVSISGGDAESDEDYRVSILHARPDDSAGGEFVMTDADALLPVIRISGRALHGAASDAFYRRGFMTITFSADDNNDVIPAATVSLTAAVIATIAADTGGITTILPAGRNGIIGTALFYDAQGTLSVSVSRGFTISVLPQGGVGLSPSGMYYPFVAAADAPDGKFAVYATLRATGVLMTGTLVGGYTHGPHIPATALFTASIRGVFGIGARDGAAITTYFTATIATLSARNFGLPPVFSLLGDSPVSLSGSVLILTATVEGAHSITVTVGAEDNSAFSQITASVLTLSFYAVDPPPVVIGRDAGRRFTVVMGVTTEILVDSGVSVSGGYRHPGALYDLSVSYDSLSGREELAVSISLADNGMLYVRGRTAAVVPITVYADDNHPNTKQATLVLTSVYQRGIVGAIGGRAYTPQDSIIINGHNRITVRAGYPFLDPQYARSTDYDSPFGGGIVMHMWFVGHFGRPEYTLTAPGLMTRHVRTRKGTIYATVAKSDSPFVVDREVEDPNAYFPRPLDLLYVHLRLRTATVAAEMTATIIVGDSNDSGYVPATVFVEVTVNREISISASVPPGVVLHHHGNIAATLASLGGDSDNLPITYRSMHDIAGLQITGGLMRYLPPVERLHALTVTVVGEDSYQYVGAGGFSVHAQTALLTLTAAIVPGVNISVDMLATVFNPGFTGTVGVLSVLRGHLEPGGSYSLHFEAGDSFALANGTIFFRSNTKGRYVATIVADDDYEGALPVTMLVTVRVERCRFFSPYCPGLGHRAKQAGDDFTFDGAEEHLQSLLRAGVDPNEISARGITPLMLFRNGGAVSVFVGAGASVNVKDTGGCTPLYHAANGGDAVFGEGDYIRPLIAMRILLDANADPNAETCGGARAMHVAFRAWPVAHILLNAGASINATLEAEQTWDGIRHPSRSTPYDIAARRLDAHTRENPDQDIDTVPYSFSTRYIRFHGGRCSTYCRWMDTNLDGERVSRGIVSIRIAQPAGTLALLGNTVTVGIVKANGGGADAQYIYSLESANNAFTVSPDSRALVFVGDGSVGLKTARMEIRDISPLLPGGPLSVTVLVVNKECGYFAPNNCGVFSSVYSGDDAQGGNNPAPEVLWQLVNAGINADERERGMLKTPLHLVRLATLAQILLAGGANPDLQDATGGTPLYHHARRLAFGGLAPDDDSDPPRMFVDVLARHNADTSIADNYGETPLHLAVNDGGMVDILLRFGAPINATVWNVAPGTVFSRLPGDTPLDNANRYSADRHPGRDSAALIAAKGGRCNNACLPGNRRLDGVAIVAPPPLNPVSTLYILGGSHPDSVTNALQNYHIPVAHDINGDHFEGHLFFYNPAQSPPALDLVGHRGAHLNGTLIVAGGGGNTGAFGNNVAWAISIYRWNSVSAAFDAVRDHELVAHNNEFILAGGYGEDGAADAVWASSDGVEWTRRGTLPRPLYNFGMASFNGAIYVDGGMTEGGGKSAATYRSTDGGQTWTTLAGFGGASSAQTGRAHHRLVTHRGMLYMVGGVKTGTTTEKTIWRSIDGMYWRACPDAITQGFPDAFNMDFDSFSYGGRLYVMGGGETTAPSIASCDDDSDSPWFGETYGLPARYKQRAIVVP